jgi:hypothetical protein
MSENRSSQQDAHHRSSPGDVIWVDGDGPGRTQVSTNSSNNTDSNSDVARIQDSEDMGVTHEELDMAVHDHQS